MPLTSIVDHLRESIWRFANDKRLKHLQRVVDAISESPPEAPASLDTASNAKLAGFLAAAGEMAG